MDADLRRDLWLIDDARDRILRELGSKLACSGFSSTNLLVVMSSLERFDDDFRSGPARRLTRSLLKVGDALICSYSSLGTRYM